MQLDAKTDLYAPWSDTIAPMLNDREYKPNVLLDGHGFLTEVNSSIPPEERRSGPILREDYNKLRPKFSVALTNWSKSGQNEVDNFLDYV